MRRDRLARSVVGAAVVLASALAAPPAGAATAPSPPSRPPVAPSTAEHDLVSRLPGIAEALGESYGGAWFDDAGTLHVEVAGDPAAAASVLPPGAVADQAPRSWLSLQAVRDQVLAALTEPSFADAGVATVSVDERASQVVVGVTGDTEQTAAAFASRFGSAVAVTRVAPPQALSRTDASQSMKAGLEISSSEGLVCSSAFGAHRANQRYVMTAGHCGSNGAAWRIGSNQSTPYFGAGTRRTFVSGSSTDSEAITVADTKGGPTDCVYESDALCRPVIGFATYLVQGQTVCKSGRTTDVTCGQILSPDVTVTYSGSNVTITHAVAACVALDSGDSGAPVYFRVGNSAVGAGMLSGSTSTTTACGGNVLVPATVMFFTRWSNAMTAPGYSRLRPGYRELTEFTGDTCADLVAKAGTYLFTYSGNCTGGFLGWQYANQGWAPFDQLTRTTDFSGDGCADVLGRTPADGRLWLYRSACTGGFAQGGAPIDSGWNIFSTIVAPGDFTGDGCADVLGITPGGAMVRYPGACNGTLVQGGGVVMNQGWNIFSEVLAPGDFNNDGCNDLIGITPSGDMYFYAGDCAGSFRGGGQLINTGWNMFTQVIAPGDFSGDGCPDLIGRTPSGYLLLYQGNCSGGFAAPGYVMNSGWNIFDDVF